GCRGVSGRGASHPFVARLARERCRNGHTRIFERSGWIHALVLGHEPVYPSRSRTACQLVKRRVALTQRDGHRLFVKIGKQLAEAPDSADIFGLVRTSTLKPGTPQCRHVKLSISEKRFQQVATVQAAQIGGIIAANLTTVDAAKLIRASCQSTRGIHSRKVRPLPEGDHLAPRRYLSVLSIQSSRGGLNTSRSTVSASASALCGICGGMVSTSPALTTISLPSIQNFSAPSRM